MDLPHTLLVTLFVALGVFAVGLARGPLQRTWDWWLTLSLVLGITALVLALAGVLAGALAGISALSVLAAIPWSLTRSAWRKVARGEIAPARSRAAWVHAMHPMGDTRRLRGLIDLAARVESGEDVDIDQGLADQGLPAGLERTVTAIVLASWGGDFAQLTPMLEDAAVRREAIRRGNGAVVLAAAGESGGAEAVARVWPEVSTGDRVAPGSSQTGGLMLVAAAHLGAVDLCLELSRELSRELPTARRAFWLATAEQRAGDVVSAHDTLEAAVRAHGPSWGGRARLERRMMHPVTPVATPPPTAVAELTETLRQRVAARRALAGLGISARRPSPVTFSLAVVLGVMFVGELLLGRGALTNETLYRLGGLLVPAPSVVAVARVFTYGLVHAGATHLTVNVVTLWFFGRFVEQRLGGARMLVVYVLAGAAGGAAALIGSPAGTLIVGASGSIFGLVGAAVGQILGDPDLRRTPEGRSELTLLAVLVGVQAIGDAITPHVSSMAHAGGLLLGLALGVMVRRR